MTYNFNMIVMDMARGEVADIPYDNFLTIQSQCQEYIDDVLAALYYDFKDQGTNRISEHFNQSINRWVRFIYRT